MIPVIAYAARSQAEEAGKDSTGDQLRLVRERVAREGGRERDGPAHPRPADDHRALPRLLGGAVSIDPTRMENEIALIADRSDATEELARLDSHFDQFEKALEDSGPVGRKLDFLLQEMGRELNTLGSKSRDAETTRSVIDAKVLCEQLREQIQNVE